MAKPKKTIEELGKIEFALKQKYGEEAIVNPLQFWTKEKEVDFQEQIKESLEKQRNLEENEERIEKDGFLVSKRLFTKNGESCPICQKYLLDSRDVIYIAKFECCSKCYIQYVEDREERWKTGWRPSNK